MNADKILEFLGTVGCGLAVLVLWYVGYRLGVRLCVWYLDRKDGRK